MDMVFALGQTMDELVQIGLTHGGSESRSVCKDLRRHMGVTDLCHLRSRSPLGSNVLSERGSYYDFPVLSR